MRDLLRQQIAKALQVCFDNNTLHSGKIPDIQVEVPGNPDHGDFATNLAMTMARAEKKSPADANVIIRGHQDVAAGQVQEIIRVAQDQQLERFALRAKEDRS